MGANLPRGVQLHPEHAIDVLPPPDQPADPVERVLRDPRYARLKGRRSRFGWTLAALMMVVYYGFILLVAFDKALLARPIGTGVTTLGMPLGLGVIVFTIAITGLYVRRANREFDEITRHIVEGARR